MTTAVKSREMLQGEAQWKLHGGMKENYSRQTQIDSGGLYPKQLHRENRIFLVMLEKKYNT